MTAAKSAPSRANKPRKTNPKTLRIAVIGGGPKAAALAAKAEVLRRLRKANVRVTIFEPDEIGAAWVGASGYTDGEQRLCTIAERDVGYPYNSMFGPYVASAMASTFSWGRYLQSTSKSGYNTWVDSGRKPPLHRDFADYIQWVVQEASPRVIKERVSALSCHSGKWRVTGMRRNGKLYLHSTLFDAVVATGPGPARRVQTVVANGVPSESKRIFSGQDFWTRLDEVRACLGDVTTGNEFDSAKPIVIIGAGGTAAAVLSWLVSNGARHLPIQMVASQPALYTRVDSVFENRLFTDDEQWQTLAPRTRKAFFDRLNRGVVWATVMDQVSTARDFTMVAGRAKRVKILNPDDIQLSVKRDDGVNIDLTPALLVDASGFDTWWFLKLVQGLTVLKGLKGKKQRDRWQDDIGKGLQLTGAPWDTHYPPLHTPMLSSNIGPGFGSLMVLGAMADRVLQWHLQLPVPSAASLTGAKAATTEPGT